MILYVGPELSLPLRSIIAIIDAASARRERDTLTFLERARERHELREMPGVEAGSYIVTDTAVYACPVSGTALKRRIDRIQAGSFFETEM